MENWFSKPQTPIKEYVGGGGLGEGGGAGYRGPRVHPEGPTWGECSPGADDFVR